MKKIIKNSSLFLIFSISLLILGCKSRLSSTLKNGDLLFVTAKNTGISGAINNVTQKQKEASFDHIGILTKEKNNWIVLHAAPKGGSQSQNLKDFMNEQTSEDQQIILYRLKPEYQSSINPAIDKAKTLLGKPYNFNYILDENSYYCSDYIERAFRKDEIFNLEPMTFIDPKTGKTNTFWEEFYNKKGLKVPEGELGCNPNGLAASPKLERVRILK